MAVFRAQVFYRRGVDEKWSNVYHVDAGDIAAASSAVVGTLAPSMLSLLDSACQIVKVLVSDLAGTAFIETPVGSAGTSSASGDLLPLFNCVKALFSTSAIGRPDVKFLKGFVTESIQTSGNLNSGTITAVLADLNATIADMITAGAPLVSENGDDWVEAFVQTAVQMRQMHRRRRRVVP